MMTILYWVALSLCGGAIWAALGARKDRIGAGRDFEEDYPA